MSNETLQSLIVHYKYELGCVCAALSGIYLLKYHFLAGAKFDACRFNLKNKVAIITGANTGIGFEVAQELAKRGATVILACRDIKKGQEACERIRVVAPNNENLFVENLNLASFRSVKEFSNRVLLKYNEINLLINNAGVMGCSYFKTEDDFEYQIQVNYMSHYLLTRLLLNRLERSDSARIVNVTSKLYETGSLYWQNGEINFKDEFDPILSYKRSKLCNMLFTHELAKHLNGKQVTVNCVSPGIVLTGLGRHIFARLSTFKRIMAVLLYPLVWFMLRTPKQGSQTILYAALEPKLANQNGKFYRDCKEQPILPHGMNDIDSKRLWNLSELYVKKWL